MADESPTEELRQAGGPDTEDLLTKLKYLQAEFENYRKRSVRDAEVLLRAAYESLFLQLLPVLDELDAAVAATDGSAGDGIRMIRDNLTATLSEAGLQSIPARGLPFDPYVHECLEQVSDPASEDGTVKEVVRSGYRTRDRVLRPAQVVVVNNGGTSDG